MCVIRLGGCPIFKKMITKYLVPGTDLGGGCPFFPKIRDWYWVPICGGGINTSLGTWKVELVPGGLVS